MEPDHHGSGIVHGVLFLGILAAVAVCALSWPWYLLLPLLVYGGIVLAVPFLLRTAPQMTVGRLGGLPLVCTIALTIVSSGVVVGFYAVLRPDMEFVAQRLPLAALRPMIVAGVCISVVNAVVEEFVFRGILWGAVALEWNQVVALVLTTVLFGLIHLEGYPPGPLGAVLAGLYGLGLGLLRWWVGGLGLTIASHILADATIFGLIVWSGAYARFAG